MHTLALVLVLTSACLHATWNLLAKRIGGGATLVWLYDSVAAVIYAPLILVFLLFQRPQLNSVLLLFMVGSAVAHLAYFVLLQLGYRAGDLSLVYPLARGTGPLLSTILAILFLGERPSLISLAGVSLIILGVFLITGGSLRLKDKGTSKAVLFGLGTGLFIAAYTLWDKVAVSAFAITPALYYYGSSLFRVAFLTPYTMRHWSTVRADWREHRWPIIGVGMLSPLAYFLVLTAFTFAPVSFVAPGREISVLLGTIMGARLLSEGNAKRRILAACVMLLGIVALSL